MNERMNLLYLYKVVISTYKIGFQIIRVKNSLSEY